MHLSKLLTQELDAFRAKTGRSQLDILETGSIRNVEEQYHQNDGWSTLTFAEQVAEHGGSLTSIDLDTGPAAQVLREHNLRKHVSLIQGYSIDVCARMLVAEQRPSFDVILLDSDNDAGLIMHEFYLARLLANSPALILVDDVEPGSGDVVKGHQIMPWLDASGVKYRLERRTGDGYATGVLVFELEGDR